MWAQAGAATLALHATLMAGGAVRALLSDQLLPNRACNLILTGWGSVSREHFMCRARPFDLSYLLLQDTSKR